MFRTQAVILKKTSLRREKTLVILFTREYGKIHTWYRHSPHQIGDTGAIVDVFLDRRGGVTLLTKVSIQKTLIPLDHTYTEVILLLELIRILSLILPEWWVQTRIFDDYVCVYATMIDASLFQRNITLFLFRLLKVTGILNPEPFRNQSPLLAIYTHIDRVDMHRILQSEKISDESITEMKRYASTSLLAYI